MPDIHENYKPLETFCRPALATSEAWRTIAGICLIILLFGFFLAGLQDLLPVPMDPIGDLPESPGSVLRLLYSFAGLIMAIMVTLQILHMRRIGTLIGAPRAALSRFLRVAGAVSLVNLALLPLFLLTTPDIRPGLPYGQFLLYLPMVVLAVLIQTSAEELLFRGYLLQQLRARFPKNPAWLFAPTLLFALAHNDPSTYGPTAPAIALSAGLFGLIAADLTARTGSLGAAIGFHFANNLAAFCLIGVKGDLGSLALWTQSVDLRDPSTALPLLLSDAALMGISWLAARLALRV